MSRRILILAHTGRQKAMQTALQAIELLREADLTPVMMPHDAAVMHEAIHNGVLSANGIGVESIDSKSTLHDIELCMVLGGDGSVLRAAEMVRESGLPLMAVNLGHVGSLRKQNRPTWNEPWQRSLTRITSSKSAWRSMSKCSSVNIWSPILGP